VPLHPARSAQFALSGSWDGTLRLWDLQQGTTTRRFVGHTKDVLSVAFSVDNRQIVSGARDKTIKLWNTLGECKYTIAEPEGHSEWVSCVRFSPMTNNPIIVSGGWDKLVKVFNLRWAEPQTRACACVCLYEEGECEVLVCVLGLGPKQVGPRCAGLLGGAGPYPGVSHPLRPEDSPRPGSCACWFHPP
jgi:hypothetical protein